MKTRFNDWPLYNKPKHTEPWRVVEITLVAVILSRQNAIGTSLQQPFSKRTNAKNKTKTKKLHETKNEKSFFRLRNSLLTAAIWNYLHNKTV